MFSYVQKTNRTPETGAKGDYQINRCQDLWLPFSDAISKVSGHIISHTIHTLSSHTVLTSDARPDAWSAKCGMSEIIPKRRCSVSVDINKARTHLIRSPKHTHQPPSLYFRLARTFFLYITNPVAFGGGHQETGLYLQCASTRNTNTARSLDHSKRTKARSEMFTREELVSTIWIHTQNIAPAPHMRVIMFV